MCWAAVVLIKKYSSIVKIYARSDRWILRLRAAAGLGSGRGRSRVPRSKNGPPPPPIARTTANKKKKKKSSRNFDISLDRVHRHVLPRTSPDDEKTYLEKDKKYTIQVGRRGYLNLFLRQRHLEIEYGFIWTKINLIKTQTSNRTNVFAWRPIVALNLFEIFEL